MLAGADGWAGAALGREDLASCVPWNRLFLWLRQRERGRPGPGSGPSSSECNLGWAFGAESWI